MSTNGVTGVQSGTDEEVPPVPHVPSVLTPAHQSNAVTDNDVIVMGVPVDRQVTRLQHTPQTSGLDPLVAPDPLAVDSIEEEDFNQHDQGGSSSRSANPQPPSMSVDQYHHQPSSSSSVLDQTPARNSQAINVPTLHQLPAPESDNQFFDPATPMNTTFLSTLAETMGSLQLPTHQENAITPSASSGMAAFGQELGGELGGKPRSSSISSTSISNILVNDQNQDQHDSNVRITRSGRPYGAIPGHEEEEQDQEFEHERGEELRPPTAGSASGSGHGHRQGRAQRQDGAEDLDIDIDMEMDGVESTSERKERTDMMYT